MKKHNRSYILQGRITNAEDKEISHAEIIVWWQHIRKRVQLAETKSTEEGHYEVHYTVPDDAPGKVLLVVEVKDNSLSAPLFSQPTPAAPKLTINLSEQAIDSSEYASLLRAVLPLLSGLPLTALVEDSTHQDLSFLSAETGGSQEKIMQLCMAARMEEAFQISATGFYAFLAQHVPPTLPSSLLDASDEFSLIDALVVHVGQQIANQNAQAQSAAIAAAVTRNIVGPQIGKQAAEIVQQLQALRYSQMLGSPNLTGKATLGNLLDVAGLAKDKQTAFAQVLSDNVQSPGKFWATIDDGKHGFTAQEVTAVRQTLSLGVLVKNSLPIVRQLNQQFAAGKYHALPELATLTVQDWETLITASGSGAVPSNIAAVGSQSAASVFAQETYDRVTRTYPTAALLNRVGNDALVPSNQQQPVAAFFTANPQLDLRRQNLDVYLKQTGETAYGGVQGQDRITLVANVRAFQRLLRITPHVDIAARLLKMGIQSAAAVTVIGRQQFVNKLIVAGASSTDAFKTYYLAEQRYASVVALWTQFRRDFVGIWPQALGSYQTYDDPKTQAADGSPTLELLFGSQDYCEVDFCTSLLSPAAYLTDLLMWLSQRTAGVSGGFSSALDVLLARRPDLGTLLLNCPNTDTAIPYIDLVNELLEDAVSAPPPGMLRQTELSAEQLRAAPDPNCVNMNAYGMLRTAKYPHTLPYDAPLDQLRTVLAQSNVALWQVRQGFQPLQGAAPTLQEQAIASERFGISLGERALITIPDATLATQAVVWNTADPAADLTNVATFMSAADITYDQLLQLLTVVWTRNGGSAMQISGVDDTCSTLSQTLAPLDLGRLDCIHRFLRLWRRTGWKMWELDLVLNSAAVSDASLSGQTLVDLFSVQQLLDTTHLSIDVLLTFFRPYLLDTKSYVDPGGEPTTPLYASLFEDPATSPDPLLAHGSLDGTSDLSNHKPAIQAALQVSSSDADILLGLTDNKRTLANISQMYCVAKFAAAASLTIKDALTIGPATFTDVFQSASTMLSYLGRASSITKSGFSVDALTYLLTTSPAKMQLSDTQVATILGGVRTAMQKVHDSIHVSSRTAYQILKAQLAQWPVSNNTNPSVSDPIQLTTAMQIVDGSYIPGVPPSQTQTYSEFITQQFGSFMTAQQVALAIANLTPNPLNPALPPGPGIAYQGHDLDQRVQYVLGPLEQFLIQTQVVASVAGSLSIATDVTAYLMSNLTVPKVPAATNTLLNALTDPSLIAPGTGGFGYLQDLTAANFPDPFASLRLMHKENVIVGKLTLSLSELTWLLSNAAVYGGVDLTQLPVVTGQAAQLIDTLLATVLLVQLNRGFNALANSTATPSPTYPNLFSIISATKAGAFAGNDAAAQGALAGVAGAGQTDITALAQALGMTVAVGDYLQPSSYDRMRQLLAMMMATSGSGATLVSWSQESADLSGAVASALQALKSRFSDDGWLVAAQALNDPLRQDRRDALVAYLISQRSGGNPVAWGKDSDSLFNYFLIDVEMSACQVTTRVVQAYAAVQLFVQRCLMNLESALQIDLTQDNEWGEWSWRKRYRLWEANRKVFLYPENWLIEADRPNSSEIFEKLEKEAHQQADTSVNLESTVLNYIDRLDHIAHLRVTGTCEDPVTQTIHVVARTHSDPPLYYHRTFDQTLQIWSPWTEIPLQIKAHHVVPVVYRRGVYLFWPQVLIANEPQQMVPAAQPTSTPQMSTPPAQHVEINLAFSVWRNGKWTPPQWAAGKLYDVPLLLLEPSANATSRAVEALYTLKVQLPATGTADMMVDVFRYGDYSNLIAKLQNLQQQALQEVQAIQSIPTWQQVVQQAIQNGGFWGLLGVITTLQQDQAQLTQDQTQLMQILTNIVQLLSTINDSEQNPTATHIGRAVFDGRFSALEMRDQPVILNSQVIADYLNYAQQTYGHDAEPLTALASSDVDASLTGELILLPKAGALATVPIGAGQMTQLPLQLTMAGGNGTETLLNTAQAAFRLIGDATNPQFDPTTFFFYTDPKRSYYVQATRYYQYGSQWRPVPPSNAATAAYQVRYAFQPFYHPYTKLFWHEIFNSDLAGIYNTQLQVNPTLVDPSHADQFSFQTTYNPVVPVVSWGPDADIIDFSSSGTYASYNWELFFHIPLYVSQRLSQNQQFEDAMTWFHYIFNPTLPGTDPQRFWIPAPLNGLTSAAVQQQSINQILLAVNQNDPTLVGQVTAWQHNPFNPFFVANLRPVAYMKQVVMAYLDNLIAWGDNLFSTDSRENLNQATLLYVLVAQILGPRPTEVPPPGHADASFNTLRPQLDAFVNAMVEVENLVPASNQGAGGTGVGGLPAPHTFYFKIPPNDKLLGYWDTLADRLFKLRNCEDISGQALNLPLFDAPIDPGLLIAAQAAGVDIGSVLNDLTAPIPHYRYSYLYLQAQDFCTAVRGYGAQLLTALEKKDGATLALLMATLQQQLLADADQIYLSKVNQANQKIAALSQALALQQSRQSYYQSKSLTNAWEDVGLVVQGTMIAVDGVAAVLEGTASVSHLIPQFLIGVAGFGGTPTTAAKEGGRNLGDSVSAAALAGKTTGQALDRVGKMAETIGKYAQRMDDWVQKGKEAGLAIARIQAEIAGANFALAIAQREQVNHQTAIDNLQQEIDFLTNKFTNEDLYDWMVGKLADTYFQSYQLAYKIAKRSERCYQYELGLDSSSFIQFGYWDSLHKGLLAGESLAHDLRRLQSSYLDLNARRNEISRIYSLAKIDPSTINDLKNNGKCNFSLDEMLFDADYPGQYQRQIKRVSLTVVYASPGIYDNVTCRLSMVSNRVRMNTQLNTNSDPYIEITPPDPRFHYNYAGAQSIVMSHAQDDPALFENNVHYQITDPRYLPFEGAGTISDWMLELPKPNGTDAAQFASAAASASDVLIHLLFTTLDGDANFETMARNSHP